MRQLLRLHGITPHLFRVSRVYEVTALPSPYCRERGGAAQVPPARSSAGHRAQDWNVEQWLQEVTLRLAEQVCHCLYRPPPPLNPTCDCGVADGS